MIVTKASLSAVKVARRDKDLPVLDNVRIEKDGTTVACARNIVLAISPPAEARAAQAPVGNTGPLHHDLTIPSEYVKGVLKEVKTDKTFDGLLEYVDVHELSGAVSNGAFTWIEDGCPKTLRFDSDAGAYIDYRKVFARSLTNRTGVRLKMNRVRLKALVDTLDKVAPDNGEAPVYIEFTETGDMIMRATNDKTGQRAVAVMTHFSERGDDWLDPDEWERGLCDGQENSGNHSTNGNDGHAVRVGRRCRTSYDEDVGSNRAVSARRVVANRRVPVVQSVAEDAGIARRPEPQTGARRRRCNMAATDEVTVSGSSNQKRRRTIRGSRTDVRSSASVRRVVGRTEGNIKQCARVARRERKR
jgi:hypothetical protein